ncbi:MFS transporter [Orbus sturtevantii]|uniref:MFS transporter n=1 Tax=Orbus sturtevantii TaxID=3074109 RepID=UPI00370DDBB9
MNKPLIAIFTTILLDAIGIGIIFPILPALLRDITQTENIAIYMGILTMLYALMQFIFSPLLGALSDRMGRRTVLLLSLAGAAISYVFIFFSTNITSLIISRAIAGITSASLPAAMACVTDISAPEKRTRYFGLFNAMFGMGFILGPIFGGILGEYWVRLPFLIVSLLNAGNFLFTLLVLPETCTVIKKEFKLLTFTPLQSVDWLLTTKNILPIISIFLILSFTGEACSICWAMWGNDAFGWNGYQIGLSLAMFGLCQSLSQIFLPELAVRILGRKKTILLSILALCIGFCTMAFATSSWMVFMIIPVFTLGSIGNPALQSFATTQILSDQQGQLQGVISSTLSLSSIIAPLFFSFFYFTIRNDWPGAIWVIAAAINIVAIPVVLYIFRLNNGTQ